MLLMSFAATCEYCTAAAPEHCLPRQVARDHQTTPQQRIRTPLVHVVLGQVRSAWCVCACVLSCKCPWMDRHITRQLVACRCQPEVTLARPGQAERPSKSWATVNPPLMRAQEVATALLYKQSKALDLGQRNSQSLHESHDDGAAAAAPAAGCPVQV